MSVKRLAVAALAVTMALLMTGTAIAQGKKKSPDSKDAKEVYTGTLMATNGPMRTTSFTLSIKDYTSDELAQNYLAILVEGDQSDLLKKIDDLDLGYMSAAGSLGRRLVIVRKAELPDGKTRIRAVFERWQSFAEVRNGYRVQDYPFGIIEIVVDAKGKGTGTFIAACMVYMKKDKK